MPAKTYTACYSLRAGRGGEAPDKEDAHIVELFRDPNRTAGGPVWRSHGMTLCDVYAERDSAGNLVAARHVPVDAVTCTKCRYYMRSIRMVSAAKPEASDARKVA